MRRLSSRMVRIIGIAVVLAIVVGAAAFLLGGGSTRKVTAHFASGVGVYSGTPVKILGVQVGQVTSVTPEGGSVRIAMNYDAKYHLPSNAVAVVVANSLVSDRYIQLAPAYSGGPQLADSADIPLNRTGSPAELDDIYSAMNQLAVALGPKGANKNGALSALLDVSAANLQGNGAAFGQSITSLSQAISTLSNGREDLFGTVKNLQVFSQALASSDAQVRHVNQQLAQVAGDLAAERGDLGAALHNLSIALTQVAGFVRDNASGLHADITGLESLSNVLAREHGALDESLAVAPVALSNLTHAYQESTGTLGTRSNLSTIGDPTQICAVLSGLTSGGLVGLLTGNLLGSQTQQIVSTCQALAKSQPNGQLPPSGLPSGLLNLNGGLPTIPGVTG